MCSMVKPRIGITVADEIDSKGRPQFMLAHAYVDWLSSAGAAPLLLPPVEDAIPDQLAGLRGLVMTGGDDPDMTAFGQQNHDKVNLITPRRQAYELRMLDTLKRDRPDFPVLGICLGMQLMALHAGGDLYQYLPDLSAPVDAAMHHGNREHSIVFEESDSILNQPCHVLEQKPNAISHHRQAVSDAGSLRVIARADDGIIEAIDDPGRDFYLGVQWHPERGGSASLTSLLAEAFVASCR